MRARKEALVQGRVASGARPFRKAVVPTYLSGDDSGCVKGNSNVAFWENGHHPRARKWRSPWSLRAPSVDWFAQRGRTAQKPRELSTSSNAGAWRTGQERRLHLGRPQDHAFVLQLAVSSFLTEHRGKIKREACRNQRRPDGAVEAFCKLRCRTVRNRAHALCRVAAGLGRQRYANRECGPVRYMMAT